MTIMMDTEDGKALLRSGPESFNAWRADNPSAYMDLGNVEMMEVFANDTNMYAGLDMGGYNFSGLRLNMASFRNMLVNNCDFTGAKLTFSDLCFASFQNCNFRGAELNVSRIGSASFDTCDFSNARLSYCSGEKTSFRACRMLGTYLDYAQFHNATFADCVLRDCLVYGVACWDVDLRGTRQSGLQIAKDNPALTVDDIELAQFVYLLMENAKVRNVIETLTTRVVLILGRFSSEKKRILEVLREQLRRFGYVTIVFDFDKPSTRTMTETVSTIAHVSKLVIADISDPRSVPQELQAIVPHIASLKVQPIIGYDDRPYGMFQDFVETGRVCSPIAYSSDDLSSLIDALVAAHPLS